MKKLTKMLVVGTAPVLVAGALGAQAETSPATQPATQPSAQAATEPVVVAQSNAPLVIPDGTSLQNPGPLFRAIDVDRFGRSYDAPNTLVPIGVNPVVAPEAPVHGTRL